MRATKKYLAPAIIAVAGLTLAGCAPSAETPSTPDGSDKAPVSIAIITSQTGPLGVYGAAYLAGFEAGLDYATDGTGAVDGRELDITYIDDAGDTDKAVTAAKDVIGQGTKIIAGTASSGIALALAEQAEQNKILYISGPAAADAITGVNDYTFRSGRQTIQDIATAGTFLGDPAGQHILVFAQATPFAQQINDAAPDLVFVAWAGTTSAAMWQALSQQGVFDNIPVVTGLGDVSTYGAYGEASEGISFLNHYFGGAAGTEAEAAMIK